MGCGRNGKKLRESVFFNFMNLKQLCYGISTFLPGLSLFHAKGTGGTNSAKYCYSVWLRHLVWAAENGLLKDGMPARIGELGPGDSLGIGLAALLSGAETYVGLDAVEHAASEKNLEIFHELIVLFRNRADIPSESEFANIKPQLKSHAFPAEILTDRILTETLAQARIDRIVEALKNIKEKDAVICYIAPWQRADLIQKGSLDMILSQAVLEHVDDLDGAYLAMNEWLKPEGFISHQIDFKSHGLTDAWNGHWALPDLLWKLIRGRRPYLLNRQPYSVHRKLLDVQGFKLVNEILVKQPSVYNKSQLAPRFRAMTEDDLTTSGAFIQAVKP